MGRVTFGLSLSHPDPSREGPGFHIWFRLAGLIPGTRNGTPNTTYIQIQHNVKQFNFSGEMAINNNNNNNAAPKTGDIQARCLTPVRSITEIYRSAETHLQKLMTDGKDGRDVEEGM